ncbi:tetratricopeptide repeat protein [Rhizobium cremeum]|nr:tetratricopeptide repeat protein [Rhizobium cremeum]MCJ7995273.1 tetratricopeptide repeat protein [Rhizobium cremeum]MCJ8000772.1 tetratricopeptide repeat protein [Rhizobium cremeum]
MKLSLSILSAAAVAGSLVTVVTDGSTPQPLLSANGVAGERQARLPGMAAQIDPEAIAEQIRATKQPRNRDAAPVEPFTVEGGGEPLLSAQAPAADAPAANAPAETSTPPAPAPAPASPATAAPASDPAPAPDLSALRYFASRGDTARLQAEIARLRALYPNWTPPSDPLSIPVGGDRQLEAMWQLYSQGRYAEVRRAIAERQTAEKGWQPPADLIERLAVAEARTRLVNASDLKQYATVIAIGAANPSLLNCSDVDVLWRVAEAFVLTERAQRGVDAYGYILKNCTDPQQRIATVQKAAALLPYGEVQTLMAFEKTGAGGAREFDPLRDDLARRFVADANDKPELTIAADYLDRLRGLAEREGLAADSLLLGWYYLRRNDMAEAEKWFRASRQKQDTASASQGLALVLIARDAPAEAEDAMYRWRDASEEATATYLATTANLLAGDPPPSVSAEVLQRVATTVLEKHYVPTAQQLGWYARAFNQWQTAARWFETALQWKPDDEPSAYGLAITRQQLNDRAGVREIQAAWAGRSERIAHLGMLTGRTAAKATDPATAAPAGEAPRREAMAGEIATSPAGPADGASVRQPAKAGRRAGCSVTGSAAGLAPAQAVARGWCLMDMNRPLEAAEAFEIALASNSTTVREDAAYGQSLAYLRLGLTGSAAVAASKAPQRPERSVELQIAILSNRAISAFDSGRYREALVYLDQRSMLKPEPTDLMILRAYSLMNLGRPGDARRIFEALAETGNRDAMRGLADMAGSSQH